MLKKLPFQKDFETVNVLKKLVSAHRALSELKGLVSTIPSEAILINTLALQEAKDSSAIENIITTHDELYKSELSLNNINSLNAKEVQNYISALKKGFYLVSKRKMLRINDILEIQSELEKNSAGFRKLPGTVLKNVNTKEVIYTPPQQYDEILELMENLITFINDDTLCDCDPLVKMAIIHYQFESIHPFYDGNGRTGRIINVLYLVIKNLLDLPILYLSRYIIRQKDYYYILLQEVRKTDNWENWILFMLDAVEKISIETIHLIKDIQYLIDEYKEKIKDNFKFYNNELIENLFKHPYTKIEFLQNDLSISRITAAKYLNELTKAGFLKKQKLGSANFYINEKLMKLLIKN